MKCYGFTNYQTWVAKTVLANDYDLALTAIYHAKQGAPSLKDFVWRMLDPQLDACGGTLAGELLVASLGEIDWYDLAENLRTESDDE